MGLHSHPYLLVGGIVLAFYVINKMSQEAKRNPRRLPLPPGPKGLPFIGTYLSMPKEKDWEFYDKWTQQYGDIFYFKVFGQSFVILGSPKRTSDLFEKRSSVFSDRIVMPMLNDLMGWGFNMAFMPYGNWWRRHRRSFHEQFHQNAIGKYEHIQTRESQRLVQRLSVSPDQLDLHIRHAFAASIMDTSYGIKVANSDDPFISTAEASLQGLADAGIPGTFLVDLIPFLKYVPAWVPGAGFQKQAADWRKVNFDMLLKPWERVKEMVSRGEAVPSVALNLLQNLPEPDDPRYAEEEEIARATSATAYVAGSDTTVSALNTFFLAMTLYPEVQRKAQAELDSVLGSGRLPDFSDREALPYITAMTKELMRWQLVAPLAVHHTSLADEEYDGYFIPKGTIIMGNSWTILHDPKVYSNPEEFQPERFLKDGRLDPNVMDPDVAAFGYGRRICPGRHFSNSSLFSTVATVLAVYNVTAPAGVKNTVNMTTGLLSHPGPYQCEIKPRSAAAAKLIQEIDV